MSANVRIALIGFGEVGCILATDLQARGVSGLVAWDVAFDTAANPLGRACAELGVETAADAGGAVAGADLIVSAVTAGQDLISMREIAPHIAPCAFVLDVNSVSPGVKQEAARVIEAAGGRYVEAAIMSPIAPRRLAAPMLLGGPHAGSFQRLAQQLGFTGAQPFSDRIGAASAAKMCRSVIVKGFEALLAESLLTARYYRVEDTVIGSLENLFPVDDWHARARYMISRSLVHGSRRAEEMEQAARTVEEAGLISWMSSACASRQSWAAQYAAAAQCEELAAMLDRMRAALGEHRC